MGFFEESGYSKPKKTDDALLKSMALTECATSLCHKLWINQFYICQKTLPVLEMNIVGGARQCLQGNRANRCTCPQEQCTCTK